MVAHQKLFSQTHRPKPMQQQTPRPKLRTLTQHRVRNAKGSSLLASGAEGATDTGSSCCPLAHRPQKYVRGLIHGSTRQPVNQAR